MKTFDFGGLDVSFPVRDASKPRALPPLSRVSRNSNSNVPENNDGLDIYGYPAGFLDHVVKITSGLPITAAELIKRVAKGIKKELLPIVKLQGVGRVRGRIMYNAGFQTIKNIKLAPLEDLTNLPLIGPRLAKKIKEQVGGFVKKETWEKLEKNNDWKQKSLSEY